MSGEGKSITSYWADTAVLVGTASVGASSPVTTDLDISGRRSSDEDRENETLELHLEGRYSFLGGEKLRRLMNDVGRYLGLGGG